MGPRNHFGEITGQGWGAGRLLVEIVETRRWVLHDWLCRLGVG